MSLGTPAPYAGMSRPKDHEISIAGKPVAIVHGRLIKQTADGPCRFRLIMNDRRRLWLDKSGLRLC
jgi:hypothetical protein